MYKYEIILYWSHEDDAFVAEVPELPGCMAHGNSQEAALKQVKKAIVYGSILPANSVIRFPNPRVSG